MLKLKPQVSLSDVIMQYDVKKGMAELLGYIQIASTDEKHYVNNERTETLRIANSYNENKYEVEAPLIIFKR